MSHITLNQLPNETVKLITSTQIITSVSTAVKELIENSLDANSKNIQVKLVNFGFDVLEVKDDGHGVSCNNVQRMFLPSYTSKISSFNDLGKLETYGFRGEALSALAKLANVSVTTKTNSDTLAMTYVINNEGVPLSSKPSHLTKGTIITITNLFWNLPVRKQYLSSKKKPGEEIKKVENVIQSLSAIHPELRINLIHNKCQVWQKNSVKGLKQSFMQVVGLKVVSKMEHLSELSNNILVDLIVPKKNLDDIENLLTNSNQSVFLYVNKRPVSLNKVSKVVMEHIFLHYTHLNPSSKFAVSLISIEVPPQEIDVNLEPNKTKILLKNENEVITLVDHILSSYFKQNINRPEPELCVELCADRDDEEKGEEEDEDEIVEENENRRNKRPRLEKANTEQDANARNKEFHEKNADWHMDTVQVNDPSLAKSSASDLCSQINSDNCTLTTQEEVRELKKLLDINSQKLITSVHTDLEVNLMESNEVQNHNDLKNLIRKPSASDAVSNNENPGLPHCHLEQMCLRPNIPEPVAFKIAEEVNESTNAVPKGNSILGSDVLNNIDLVDWSKGTVQTENGVLPGGVTLAKPSLISDDKSEVLDADLEQFDLSMQSISSQMGQKELSAFTKYAKIMRPKILSEFPGIIFTKVAGLLVDRWNALPIDDKRYYEKLAKAVEDRRKTHLEQKTLDNFTKPSKKPKESDKPVRTELKITATLQTIIQKRERKKNFYADRGEMQLIGQLQPSGNWLYRKGFEIGHVRHYGLQELILSQRMLSNHTVPLQPLPKAILISEDILGKELWKVLIGLEIEYDPVSCKYIVVSPVISKNGFRIALEKRNDVWHFGWITDVASTIPFYGVAELKDTLNLYRKKADFTDLSDLRSTAVVNYITNEAIRIVHQTPRPPDLRDIKEWIDLWQIGLTHLPPQCLHCREIFVPIYYIKSDRTNS